MKRSLLLLLSVSLCYSVLGQPLRYPETHKTDVSDDYFGTTVSDPYRWLEDDRSKETADWVQTQNKITRSVLDTLPLRDSVLAAMKAAWNYLQYSVPFRSGSNYFYFRRDVSQNQPMLFYMKSLEYVPMSYFDPNKITAEGTTSVSQAVPNHEGTFIAFMMSEAGSDWNSVRIKETKTMRTLPEIMVGIKFSQIAWWKEGFFYSRYDVSAGSNIMSDANKGHKIYYHRLNTAQDKDSLVFADNEHPLRTFSAEVSDDQQFLIITGSESTSGNNLYVQNLNGQQKEPRAIVKSFDADFQFVGNIGDRLFFYTNYRASNYKVIEITAKAPMESMWRDYVPENKNETLKSAVFCWKGLLLHYLVDASSKVYVCSIDGKRIKDINFKDIGTVDAISGSPADTNVFISYTTYTSPATIYRYNMKTQSIALQFGPKTAYNTDEFITERIFYYSKDSVKIPLFLVHKKGYKPDGDTPTLLYGYGGFNISKTPEFKPERIPFLQQGGLFAMACLRGGGEYGSTWHEAGTKLHKQRVFDDFIAAAEYLIKNNYTNPSKLAVSGRSNGGLLIGAVMTQRPDLFRVALPAVGVMDMLRYHKFTIGWSWKTDYGTSDDESEFKALYAYSPVHNVKAGTDYPATLVTTGDHDDRVVPAHSFKFIAELQAKQHSNLPVLIRIDTNAGHGAGKPTGKLIDEQTDVFTFMMYYLGMKL